MSLALQPVRKFYFALTSASSPPLPFMPERSRTQAPKGIEECEEPKELGWLPLSPWRPTLSTGQCHPQHRLFEVAAFRTLEVNGSACTVQSLDWDKGQEPALFQVKIISLNRAGEMAQ